VESLAEVLASRAGDQDSGEKARREALRKFVLILHEDTTAPLNRIDYSQEVSRDY